MLVIETKLYVHFVAKEFAVQDSFACNTESLCFPGTHLPPHLCALFDTVLTFLIFCDYGQLVLKKFCYVINIYWLVKNIMLSL